MNRTRRVPHKIPVMIFNNGSGDSAGKEKKPGTVSFQASVRQIKYVSMVIYCGTRRINKRHTNRTRRVPHKILVKLFNNGSGDSPGKEKEASPTSLAGLSRSLSSATR